MPRKKIPFFTFHPYPIIRKYQHSAINTKILSAASLVTLSKNKCFSTPTSSDWFVYFTVEKSAR